MRVALFAFGIAIYLATSGALVSVADELEKPFRLLLADGTPLDVEGVGYATPFVGDFDGDGKRDLLVGQFSGGKLRIYNNEGTEKKPKFSGFEWFKADAETGSVPAG